MAMFTFLSVSCEDDAKESLPERLFRPVSFSAAADGNNVDFTWMPIKGATYYIEISRDSLLFETDLQGFSYGEVNSCRINDLWGNTRYSARIKAVSGDLAVADSEYKAITFTTQREDIFYAVADEDTGTDRILLKWDNTKEVSHILFSIASEILPEEENEEISIPITSDDMVVGEKEIVGLIPGSEYTFRIYLGERNRGLVSVTTKELS
jgi:hypothetical protein